MKKLIIVSLVLFGCAQKSSTPTISGPITPGSAILNETLYLDEVELCGNKPGVVETIGVDLNSNGVLELNEVQTINTVCSVPVVEDEDPEHEEEHGHQRYRCNKKENNHFCEVVSD